MSERKLVVKNIMWDVDGVLANLDHAYLRLVKEHPAFKGKFANVTTEADLENALTIDPKFGSLELKVHPTMGRELDREFCRNSGGIYYDRPLYPHVKEVLARLDKEGYKQLTMSSGFDSEIKKKMIRDTLDGLDFMIIEVNEHSKAGSAANDQARHMIGEKEQKILDCLAKYKLKADETVLVDDRIFNCDTAVKIGMRAVRCTPGITAPTPSGKPYPTVRNVEEFSRWLHENTIRE
ncbi:MAG: hypothetical protein LBO78_01565 [Rickettsiales bacterium]|jgi:FMN phosphatase YigB (HAD superfamily)|nr:hypothetical protein [Rickettsiales bacterium]